VVISQRRRYTFSVPSYSPNGSLIGPRTFEPSKPSIALSEKGIALGNGFLGGPRQVSLQLTASNALSQRTALRLAQSRAAFDGLADLRGIVSQAPAYQNAEADRQALQVAKPVLEARAGSVVAQTPGISCPSIPQAPKPNQIPAVVEGAVAPSLSRKESLSSKRSTKADRLRKCQSQQKSRAKYLRWLKGL